jgi:hypothetical protein
VEPLIALGCFLRGAAKRERAGIVTALGLVMLSVASINVYVEGWETFKATPFEEVAVALLIGLVMANSLLVLRLVAELEMGRGLRAFVSSFLPVVYALAFGFIPLLDGIKFNESPPQAIYYFAILIFAIHVPAFAYGRSQATSKPPQGINGPGFRAYFPTLVGPISVLTVPLTLAWSFRSQVQSIGGFLGPTLS